MCRSYRYWVGMFASTLGCVLALSQTARADVDLGFMPEDQTVNVGDTVDIQLIAYSDDDTLQSIGAMGVILNWDPNVLELVGNIDDEEAPYEWLSSGFPDDSVFDGLNETWEDGDAMYQALAQFAPDPPAFASPQGLHVTLFRFTALAPADLTTITIPDAMGQYSVTRVFHGFKPGLEVTGELGVAELTIVPEPVSLALLALGSVALLRRRRR